MPGAHLVPPVQSALCSLCSLNGLKAVRCLHNLQIWTGCCRYHTDSTLCSGPPGRLTAGASGHGSPPLGAYFSGRSVQSGSAGRLLAEAARDSPFMLHQSGIHVRSGPAAGRLLAEAPATSSVTLHQPTVYGHSGPATGRSASLRSFNLELEHSQAASDAGSLCAESAPSEAALQQGDGEDRDTAAVHEVGSFTLPEHSAAHASAVTAGQ